jgi:hypothetical protein
LANGLDYLYKLLGFYLSQLPLFADF